MTGAFKSRVFNGRASKVKTVPGAATPASAAARAELTSVPSQIENQPYPRSQPSKELKVKRRLLIMAFMQRAE
jgi:hypothetical protein